MKKFLSFITLLLLAVFLVACGETNNDNKENNDDKPETKVYELSVAESDKQVQLQEGQEVTITPTYTNGATLAWASADVTIASVNNGTIKGLKAGTTTVTVKLVEDETKTATINVTVSAAKTYELAIADADKNIEVEEGQEVTITPTYTADATLVWASADATVATVEAGKITGIKAGTTTVTVKLAEDETKTATINVTVKEPAPVVYTLTLEGAATVTLGETINITPALTPALANASYTWEVDNTKIATITNGALKGVKYGTVTVKCLLVREDGGPKTEATLSVKVVSPKLTGITITGPTKVAKGSNIQLEYALAPNKVQADVTWSSEDTTIATVDEFGKVTGVAQGTVKIKCTGTQTDLNNTVVQEYTIEVTAPNPTSCVVAGSGNTVAIGGTLDFTATLAPAGCNETKTWKTDHPYLATIDQNGQLTGVLAGKVKVYCYTADENVFGVYEITVQAPAVTTVTIFGLDNIKVGEKVAYKAIAESTQNEQVFLWESTDTNILTVDAAGNVTAVAAGTATLKAVYPGTEVVGEKTITVGAAIAYTNTIVIDPSLTSTENGAKITVEEVEYTFGTDIFASLAAANLQDNTHVILMQGDYPAYTINASNIKFTVCVDNVAKFADVITLGNDVHDVIFDGFFITGQVVGGTANANIIFQNMTFDKGKEGTLYFNGQITNLQVLNCKFINVSAYRSIRFEANCVLKGFICENTTFEGTGNFDYIRGIAGADISGIVRIANCTFTKSSQSGVQFSSMGSAYLEIVGCEFYDMKNTAIDLRINSVGPFLALYNVSYNIFDNTNVEVDEDDTWGCIRMRFNNYTHETIKVNVNYNEFINWNDGSVYLFNNASQSSQPGYFVYKLCNFENNYFSYEEINDFAFQNSAAVYSVISAAEVERAIELFKLDQTDDTVKLVGTSSEFSKQKYATLAAALAAADEGDTIYLLPGTYAEDVTIDKNNITIRSLLFGTDPTKFAENEKAVIYTGKINLAKKVKGVTIDGLYFTGNAQILNVVGDVGTAQETDTNIDGFNFLNNYVESKLASGKGFIYFVENSSSYSHDLVISGNYFEGKDANTEALVYIDNVYNLTLADNTFANAKGKGFYINDSTKGLSGQYCAFVSNKFVNCANGLWINWLSPLPLSTETAEVYICNNEFNNISGIGLYVGRMNNTDTYKFFEIQYNKFNKVATCINLDRVTTSCALTCKYNVFEDVPTTAYYVSNQLSSATFGSIDASYNAFMDGNGNYIEPDAAKFTINNSDSAPIILDNRCESAEDLYEFVEVAFDIELIVPEELYAGQNVEVQVNVYPEEAFYKDVTFIVADPTILVIENGMIKPLKSGSTDVTVIYNKDTSIKYTETFKVKEYNVLELRYEGNGILKANDTVDIVATMENVAAGTQLIWSSSNEAVATVDQNGKVTAVAKGVVNIFCKIDGVEKTASVGFSVVDDDSLANELLKLLVEANNGVIMYEKINYCGYESGCEAVPHYVYGSANKYFAGTNPTIQQNPIPSTNENCEWEERTGGIRLITVHDTGAASAGSNALANSKWCTSASNTNSSWHYTIGNDGIYQQLDDKYVAWHAGDGSETITGLQDTGVVATEAGKRATVVIDDGYYVVNGTKTTILAPKGPEGQTLTTDDIVDSGIVTIIGEDNHYYIGTYYNSTYKKIASYGGYSSIGIETAVNKGSDVYLTWQYTAKFVASKLVQYDLTLDRVVFHNNLSGKNCPQTMRTANKCDMFMEMVATEYYVQKNFSDYTITFTSSNPNVLDNTGRVVGNGPRETTQVNYTITVTNGTVTASQECSVLVIGTRNAK